MKHHESKLQAQCVKWFRYQYPNHVLFSVPNGGLRSYKTAIRMKQEGALAGVPDLFLAESTQSHAGLFIEMKVGTVKPTDKQEKMHEQLRVGGYRVEVCRSFDEFVKLVEDYFQDQKP
jgi:hypothetical protein